TVAGTTAYKFFWAADGVPNDVTRPFMEVQLTIQPDEDKPATITTADAAKALWEELLQGIKIRPGAAQR
ncbi:MAG: T6SS immunity protein Tli4 family protein, partial [Rhodanobacter sp.]